MRFEQRCCTVAVLFRFDVRQGNLSCASALAYSALVLISDMCKPMPVQCFKSFKAADFGIHPLIPLICAEYSAMPCRRNTHLPHASARHQKFCKGSPQRLLLPLLVPMRVSGRVWAGSLQMCWR